MLGHCGYCYGGCPCLHDPDNDDSYACGSPAWNWDTDTINLGFGFWKNEGEIAENVVYEVYEWRNSITVNPWWQQRWQESGLRQPPVKHTNWQKEGF